MKLNQCGKIHLLACKLVIFTKLANEHHSNCHERNFLGTSVTRKTRWKQTASSMVFFTFLKFTLSYPSEQGVSPARFPVSPWCGGWVCWYLTQLWKVCFSWVLRISSLLTNQPLILFDISFGLTRFIVSLVSAALMLGYITSRLK